MDTDRFDHLTRILFARVPRRGVLGLLAAGVASRSNPVVANKRCRPRCGPCADCYNGKCHRRVDGFPCGITGQCAAGQCNCPTGKRYCANAAACAECCRDDDCGDCTECRYYPESYCVAKGDAGCSANEVRCIDRVCKPDIDEYVCENTCCDGQAGEEACGRDCCNGLMGQTCCAYTLCCGPDEECIGDRCVQKCPGGQARCGTAQTCCALNQACVDGRCKDKCAAGREFCHGACCEKGEQCCDGACRWMGTCPAEDACMGYTCERCKPVQAVPKPYGTRCGGTCGVNGCLICSGGGGCGCLEPCN